MAARSTLEVGFVVANATSAVVDPELSMANLLVDGVASIDSATTVGNGATEAGDPWYGLPAGASIERTWSDMGESLFEKPGTYELVLEVRGVRSAPVEVQVTP
jgi:hypothetical protein